MSQSTPSSQYAARRITATGRLIGDLRFTVNLVSSRHSLEEICDRLSRGDLLLYWEDATLFDDDGEILGTISWHDYKGDFVVHDADPVRDVPAAIPRDGVHRRF